MTAIHTLPVLHAVSRIVAASCLAVTVTVTVRSQCPTHWGAALFDFSSGDIQAITVWDPDGDGPLDPRPVVGGTAPATKLAYATSNGWVSMDPMIGYVSALTTLPNGDLVAAGQNGIARLNGGMWSNMGFPMTGVTSLAVLSDGRLVAGGIWHDGLGGSYAGVGMWADGLSPFLFAQFAFALPIPIGEIWSLHALPDGGLLVGGMFETANGNPGFGGVARWHPVTSWDSMAGGPGNPSNTRIGAVTTLLDGTIVAGGSAFPFAAMVKAWNGTSWQTLGSGLGGFGAVRCMTVLPNGDLVVGGAFSSAGGLATNNIARWNLAQWSNVGSPLSTGTNGTVLALKMLPTGSLGVGGTFTTVDGMPSGRIGYVVPDCGPFVFPIDGCPSSGGANRLVALTLPWADATFHARGTGLPTTALVLAVTSVTRLQPPVPLNLVHALGVPGCVLDVAPDILEALITTNGTATSQLYLPNTPPLVGVTFFHQMVPIELDSVGDWVEITSTNTLQLTVGQF
jgi:hypothetical protein